MTRYQRSRLHDEVAAYLAFWAIVGPRPLPPELDPWRHLKECIALLRAAGGWEDAN